MSDVAAVERVVAFESASELRERHTQLLEALDHELGEEGSASAEAAALSRLAPKIRLMPEGRQIKLREVLRNTRVI